MAKSKDDEVPEGLGNKEERLKRTRELGALEVLGQRLIAKPWDLQKVRGVNRRCLTVEETAKRLGVGRKQARKVLGFLCLRGFAWCPAGDLWFRIGALSPIEWPEEEQFEKIESSVLSGLVSVSTPTPETEAKQAKSPNSSPPTKRRRRKDAPPGYEDRRFKLEVFKKHFPSLRDRSDSYARQLIRQNKVEGVRKPKVGKLYFLEKTIVQRCRL